MAVRILELQIVHAHPVREKLSAAKAIGIVANLDPIRSLRDIVRKSRETNALYDKHARKSDSIVICRLPLVQMQGLIL